MTPERWSSLRFEEQMGHITSEIIRARHWEEASDRTSRNQALERVLELVDASLDCHHGARCRELTLLREVVSDCFAGTAVYDVGLSDLQQYGMPFAVRAREKSHS